MLVGGGRARPDNEPTHRAKLAAQTARGRAAAHGRIEQPGPQDSTRGTRNTSGAASTAEKSELLVVLRVLVGLAAVGAAERADRRHLLGR